jgi:hypothetical protein
MHRDLARPYGSGLSPALTGSITRDGGAPDAGELAVVGDVGGLDCKCGARLRAARDRHNSSGHTDGSPCPLRWSEPDYDALAVRLGLIEVGEALAS